MSCNVHVKEWICKLEKENARLLHLDSCNLWSLTRRSFGLDEDMEVVASECSLGGAAKPVAASGRLMSFSVAVHCSSQVTSTKIGVQVVFLYYSNNLQ